MRRRSTRGLSFSGMLKPGQPIQVNVIDFLQPERAETSPPEDILKWYSPLLSFEIVMGSRLDTTMSFCFSTPLMLMVGEMGEKGWWEMVVVKEKGGWTEYG